MRRWFTVAVIAFGILIGTVILEPGEALAYVGPPMKVIYNRRGSTGYENWNLNYAVDNSPSTCAIIGTHGAEAAWQFADDQPRWVTGVKLTIKESNIASMQVFGPDGTFDLAYKYPEPRLMLGFWIKNAQSEFITQLCDVQITFASVEPPGSPQNLRVLELAHDRVAVAWDAPADGGHVTEYRVYRNGVHLATVDTTSYVDTDVAPLTEYTYEVSAVGPGGESPRSGPLVVTTPEEPVIPPPEPPTGLQVTPIVAGLRVSWSPSPSADVVGYRVYLDGDLVFETSETTVTLTDLEPGRTYHVAVTAVAVDGRESPATTGSGEPFDVPQEPPGPVQAARARVGARRVELVWTSPAAGGVATEYQVYRDGVLLGTTTDTRWVDSTVEPDSQYLYVIVAVNDLGTSEPVELTVRTPPAGLLEGASPGLSGLGREVGAGIGLLLQPALVAAGLILGRIITTRGLRWVGVWRRG